MMALCSFQSCTIENIGGKKQRANSGKIAKIFKEWNFGNIVG